MTTPYLTAHRIVLEMDEIDRRQREREASCNGTEASECPSTCTMDGVSYVYVSTVPFLVPFGCLGIRDKALA